MSTFVNCINRINNTQVDNAQDVDAVIVTYFPSRFHLIHFLYQSLSIQFMYRSPTHSSSYSFLSHSFYKSYSISFTFATFCFAHTASYSSFIVSLIFEPILSLETRSVFRKNFNLKYILYHLKLNSDGITIPL